MIQNIPFNTNNIYCLSHYQITVWILPLFTTNFKKKSYIFIFQIDRKFSPSSKTLISRRRSTFSVITASAGCQALQLSVSQSMLPKDSLLITKDLLPTHNSIIHKRFAPQIISSSYNQTHNNEYVYCVFRNT